MKAISVLQPWGTLMRDGDPTGRKKTIETRTWSTKHRGDLLFVASKGCDGEKFNELVRELEASSKERVGRCEVEAVVNRMFAWRRR